MISIVTTTIEERGKKGKEGREEGGGVERKEKGTKVAIVSGGEGRPSSLVGRWIELLNHLE